MRRLLALAVFTTLTSSALAAMPWNNKDAWSEVDGSPVKSAPADTVGVTVLSIDRKSLSNPREQVKLDPGKRALLLAGTRASSEGTVAVPYRFDAAPCVRYRLAGRQASPGDARLDIVVVAQEAIAGCIAPAGTAVVVPTPAPAAAPMVVADAPVDAPVAAPAYAQTDAPIEGTVDATAAATVDAPAEAASTTGITTPAAPTSDAASTPLR
jgi:hypothetical protein